MPQNPKIQTKPEKPISPELADEEMDEAALDEVAGGQMQHENRSYTAVSNIMKAKHEAVKNSISNVR